jgi:hypothetical protein
MPLSRSPLHEGQVLQFRIAFSVHDGLVFGESNSPFFFNRTKSQSFLASTGRGSQLMSGAKL